MSQEERKEGRKDKIKDERIKVQEQVKRAKVSGGKRIKS